MIANPKRIEGISFDNAQPSAIKTTSAPITSGQKAWDNFKATSAVNAIQTTPTGRKKWEQFKYDSAQKVTQEMESMTGIDYFDPVSIATLGSTLGDVTYEQLMQLAYDGKIKITDPGTRNRLVVSWNPGWNASNYAQDTGAGRLGAGSMDPNTAEKTRGLIDAMVEQKRTGSAAVYDYMKPFVDAANNANANRQEEAPTWWEVIEGGITQGGASVVDTIGATLYALEDNIILKPLEWLTGVETQGIFENPYKNFHQTYSEKNAEYQQMLSNGGQFQQFVGKYLPIVTAAAPQMLLALVTSGASTATTATLQATSTAAQMTGTAATVLAIANTAKQFAMNPSFQYAFASTFGNEYMQAKEDGASDAEAYLYAMLASTVNAAVEVGGGIEGDLDVQKPLLREWAKTAIEEGGEEVVQGIISQAFQNAVYNKDNALVSLTDENAVLSGKRAAEEFAGGAIVGGLHGAMKAYVNKKSGVKNNWLKTPQNPAVSGSLSGNTQTQEQGEKPATDAGAKAAGTNTQSDTTTKQQERAIKAILDAIPKDSSAVNAEVEKIKKQNAVLDALFGRSEKAVSDSDTAKASQNMSSAEMVKQIGDAYASGEMTEEEYDNAIDALMEQESLEGVNTLDRNNPNMIKETEVNNNAGSSVSDGSSQRADGKSSGEQAGELAEGTGRDQSGQVQNVRARDRANAVARVYEAEGRQPVSGRTYLGSAYVADEGQIYDVPQSMIDGDQELSTIVSEAEGMGMTVHFFAGEAKLLNGRNADAMIRGNDVYIRVDGDKWTATQNWEHEKFHRIVSAARTVVQDLWGRLLEKTDPKKLRKTMAVYRDAYHGICDVDENGNYVWDEEAMFRVVEEILADAYAGKDTFAQNVKEYSDTTRDAASQIEEREGESRGPPTEEFSIKNTRKIPWKDQIDGYLGIKGAPKIKSSDSLYLGVSGELNGVKAAPLYVPTSIATKAKRTPNGSRSAHQLTDADLRNLQEGIKKAPAIIYNPERNALVYISGVPSESGQIIVASFDLNNDLFGENAHKATSIHPRESIVGLFKNLPKEATVFVKDENKLNDMLPGMGIHSPELLATVELISKSLSDTEAEVNENFSASGVPTATENSTPLDIADNLSADADEQDPVQALPKKAQRILETEERKLTNQLADALRVPFKSRSEQLHGLVREITTEFLQTGNVSEKTLDDLFEQAYRPNEQKLAEEYGVDVDEYRDNIERDFKAQVGNLIAQLRLANRYAADQVAGSESSEKVLPTLEDLPELYANMKAARRTADKAVARNLLTESDNAKVNRLLRGDIDESMLNPLTDNVNGILEVFRAKLEYEKFARQIRRWNAQRKEKLYELADKLLETAGEWKDKLAGWKYSRETMERNIRDIVKDKKLADEIIDTLFKPVHDAAAKATKMKNEYRDRVRALKLSRKVAAGNKISEAAAVQLLGEAEDNIRYLQTNKFVKVRDGKTLEDWSGIVRDLWESNPNLDAKKIRRAVSEFRSIYDELFEQMNEARMRNGYEPINYRKGYFPHFQSESGDGILNQFGESLGINTAAMQLPTTINGMTHTFKPGIQWFGSAQQRKGVNTSFDAVEGFDSYIEGVADVICQTDNIQRLRAFATQVRYRTSDEGLRKQVDQIRNDPRLTDEEKQNEINKKWENGKFELGNFAVELDEYTNLLAGKKSRHDRDMEQLLGRKAYAIMKAVESRVAANMVAVNPGSWLTNFIPITQGAATLDSRSLLAGMWDTLRAIKQDDGMVARSTFLTNRRGSDPIVRTWAQETSAVLSKPMELIDSFTADTLVRARFNQNVRRGMSEEAAIADADAWAAGVMADRSKGAMPTIFAQTNPFTKLLTQFQLEVNNQLSYTFKDIPREMEEKGAAALAMALLKFLIGAYLFDELYEYFIGRRPALDPLGIINDTVGDLTGYELPNLVELGTGIFTGDMPSFEVEKKGLYDAGKNLAKAVAEELPFVGSLLGGGRLPISSASPDWDNLLRAVFDESWAGEKRLTTAVKELAKPAAYILPPFGGGQVKKAVEGLDAVIRGGSYSVDNTGADILQYPVANDTFGQAGLNAISAMLFGKSSLGPAREWVESGFDGLTAKQTALFDSLREGGVSTEDAYGLIRDIEIADSVLDKILEIAELPYDETLRELAMSNVLTETQYRKYMEARCAGVSTADYAKLLQSINDNKNKRGASSVSQSDVKEALEKSRLTDAQKRAIWNSYGWKTESPW